MTSFSILFLLTAPENWGNISDVKGTIPGLLALLLLLNAPPSVRAQFSYATNADGITVTIINYTGAGGAVIIPSTNSIGMPVTSIESNAFKGTALTSVTIPNSVTSIGDYAFEDCTGLTNVTMGDSVTSIGDSAFYRCVYLTSVTIPGSVTSIGDYAFGDCELSTIYFKGNAPTADGTLFLGPGPPGVLEDVTAYYLAGGTGWGVSFANRPAVLWNPLIQTDAAGFGLGNNYFGFNITGTTNIPITVEACTNLISPVWTPLKTLTLTNGLVYFSEPVQTNSLGRYYRICSPPGEQLVGH